MAAAMEVVATVAAGLAGEAVTEEAQAVVAVLAMAATEAVAMEVA